jgi:hypothetical protein
MNQRPRKSRILRAAGRAACLLAVLATLGGHWVLLQSLAWGRMLIVFAQHGSLHSAISMTFDGRHACTLCVSIEKGRQQEQREDRKGPLVRSEQAPELMCDLRGTPVPLPPRAAAPAVPVVPRWHPSFIEPPPTPPPRAA